MSPNLQPRLSKAGVLRDSATCPFYCLVTSTYDPSTCSCRRTRNEGGQVVFDPSKCQSCRFALRVCSWVKDGIEVRREYYHPDGKLARLLIYPPFDQKDAGKVKPIHDSNPDYPMDRAGPGWGPPEGTTYPLVEVSA